MDTKQAKYARDLQDYKTNSVYNWSKAEFKNFTPRCILKKTPNCERKRWKSVPHVNFSFTEVDSSKNETDDGANKTFSQKGYDGPAVRPKTNTPKPKNAELDANTRQDHRSMWRNLRSSNVK